MTAAQRHQRVMALFDEACELPPDQRAAFLELQCGEDRDLLREVESLLEHDAHADAAV
ncbi:MAG: hypothetical protein GY842_28980, partial [bacterium]|nr:hypothetical protein [bacterium]